jgi:polysaccharide export outer membrane protein
MPLLAVAMAFTDQTGRAEGGPVPSLEISKKADDYRLGSRDLVQFLIFEEPDTLSIQRVSSTGEINVPMLGTIRVGGLSLREAEVNLAKTYVERGFFVKPQVILSVQTYAPRSVSVLGQVNHPEQIDLPLEREAIGIVQAIALAGGLTRIAKTDGIKVIRTVAGKEEQYTINLAQYLDSKSSSEFKLQADDVVYIPERAF